MAVEDAHGVISPVPLMQLTLGFWAFKTLAAAHELDLFSRLSGGTGMTSQELARALGIHERPAEMLLTGCAALGLLHKEGGRYHNSRLAEVFLVRGKLYYCGGWLHRFDQRLYPGWGKLTEALRTNRPTTWDPDTQPSRFASEDPATLALFWEAMHALSTFGAHAFGEAVDFAPFHRLLDVGGGAGAYAIELCRRYPHLRATVYDLPVVANIAAHKVAQVGLAQRIQVVSGDVFVDAHVPAGHDVILLSKVLHGCGEAQNREILRKCYQALPSGGAVIIDELLVDDEKAGPAPAALMSLNMLIDTVEGRNYTAAEYAAWLAELGYRQIQTVRFEAPGTNGAVIGYKP